MDGQVRFSGILTQELSQNLDFFNWNKVKIRYCDGASFAGHPESEFKASPVDVFQLELFFRGQLIWETLMDELLSIGLSNARQVKKRTETRRPPKEVQSDGFIEASWTLRKL
ncbi:hypothetical protein CsSME_00033161 [Camellia sinensis var. sinensis]